MSVLVDPVGGVRRSFIALHTPGRRQAHGSSLLVLPGGDLLAAWFGGDHEGAANSRILLSVRPAGSATFGPQRVLTPDAPEPQWNPVLAAGRDGSVWLFFKQGTHISTWRTFVSRAGRDLAFGDPTELVPGDLSGGRGPVRQAPVAFDGQWVAGGSVESWTSPPRWDCFVDVLTDGTWRRTPVPVEHAGMRGAGVIQPALWRNAGGGLTMLCRSSEGSAFRSATDDPLHWPALRPTGLANNNSGLAAVALPDGTVVCAHNPGSDDWGIRYPLVLSRSADDGNTWRQHLRIDDGPPPALAAIAGADDGVRTDGRGEYSYPSMALTNDHLLVSYTWQRRGIALTEIPLDLLQ